MEDKLLVGASGTQQGSLGEGLANYTLEIWVLEVSGDCGVSQSSGLCVVRHCGPPYFPPSRAFLVLIKQMPAKLEACSKVEHSLHLLPDQKFQNSNVSILETVRAERILVSSRRVCGG